MKPGSISRVLREYFKTNKIDVSVLDRRERFFATVNSIIFKNILLHRINRKVKDIESMDFVSNRIELIKTMNFFKTREWSQKELIIISPLAEIFYVEKGKSIPSLRLLHQGLDIDLALGKGWTFKVMTYKLQYLDNFNNLNNYYNSKNFVDLRLETLVAHLDRLTDLMKSIKFYEINPDLNKDKIDNPLKVLDFIKDIHNPKFKVSSDFVLFDDQYLDSSIMMDKPLGFKPKFDFDPRNKKPKISFDFGDKPLDFGFGKKK